jgi:hydroxyethylthiazole kinase
MLAKIADVMESVRAKTPLVHCITNYVTINDCANILLCFGASPAMCEAGAEVEEFVSFASALYINIGTFTKEQEDAVFPASLKAAKLNVPVVIDPVACGVISRRMQVTKKLLDLAGITIIKGNTGEIKALAGYGAKVRGVDSLEEGEDAVEACVNLAKKYNTVVAATGKTDIVTDGARTCLIYNGTPMLSQITGAGCMVGALAAAAAGSSADGWAAAAAGVAIMGLAGEMAARASGPYPGTFRVKLFDSLYTMTREDIMKGGRIECI